MISLILFRDLLSLRLYSHEEFCLKKHNVLKILFFASILSSCGLIEKFKSSEQPTDSKTSATTTAATTDNKDDLFLNAMTDSSQELKTVADDKPKNINATENKNSNDDLKSLEAEFSATAPAESSVKEVETKAVKVEETVPEIKAEVAETPKRPQPGRMMHYKVLKGETLMQIAFKIYGDISMWKELKSMNRDILTKNVALKANTDLKYGAPEKDFVWNPEGTAYMVKTGDTLGLISNSVYQTPKKWKKIWENNKPMIKNPNVIYAGFTIYYKQDKMANYVQPKANQRKEIESTEQKLNNSVVNEEVNVEEVLSTLEKQTPNEVDLTNETQSSTIREISNELKEDEKIEQSLTK